MNSKLIEKITFRTTSEIKRSLDIIARTQERTTSYIINSILRSHFENQTDVQTPKVLNDKYFMMDWLKYSFTREDVADRIKTGFIDSIKKLSLYSRKAAQDLLVIGYTEEAGKEIVLISEDNQIMALDVLARKYVLNYNGSGFKIPTDPVKLYLLYGNEAIFNEIVTAYQYI